MSQSTQLVFRSARRADVDAIVHMLADDALGAKRERVEDPLPDAYFKAFDNIVADPNNELIVAESMERIVGVLQLTFIPYLTYQGGWRALIEGVRVSSAARGRGIGRALFEWSITRARKRGCHVVQLTMDKTRTDTKRFYENLGFRATHEGMKLHL